jgi:DNA-binding NarL/FixJ family response regulator
MTANSCTVYWKHAFLHRNKGRHPMKKIRLLFVDDENNVLAALRRMLRNKKDDWDMVLVNSSQAALEALKKASFDVIVSDIKMPGMDGAELLTRVKDAYPGTIRIALSGQVDLNEVIRSIRSVHQYISKPCTAEALVARIEGALKSKEVLTDPQMLNLVTEIDARYSRRSGRNWPSPSRPSTASPIPSPRTWGSWPRYSSWSTPPSSACPRTSTPCTRPSPCSGWRPSRP